MINNNWFIMGTALSNFENITTNQAYPKYRITIEIDGINGVTKEFQVQFSGNTKYVKFDSLYQGHKVAIGGYLESGKTQNGYSFTTLVGTQIDVIDRVNNAQRNYQNQPQVNEYRNPQQQAPTPNTTQYQAAPPNYNPNPDIVVEDADLPF